MLAKLYDILHEPLAMTLCLAGILGHSFSINVLSKMPNPTNLLLISMSCSQLLLCINFLYSTLYKYGSDELCLSSLWSYAWTGTLLISVNVSVLVHMTGVFHVVALSIIRYMSLRQLSQTTSHVQWFNMKKCINTLIIIYISVIVICGPIYFHSHIAESNEPDENCLVKYPSLVNTSVHYLEFSSNEQLQQLNFWLFGFVCKLVPCSVLSMMTILLLRELKKLRELSSRFQNVERDRQYSRTTNMIIIIMVVFIVVEFPQGVLTVAQSITQIPYQDTLGDLFESLTLLTSCIIFGLFFTMNSRLRDEFMETVHTIYKKCGISSFSTISFIKSHFVHKSVLTPESRSLMQNGITNRTYGDTDV
ncbi:unnamed protein product [Bursaphelenchus xylophilus]|uniref:(pine wood nematode) hypothetical protein n=1 Tax=Bursaphelenchus xylophilus TaxID=6326 RepID=A0A1I7RPT9_BURXY|nr:unnamed protein product [Bursaphelenchus xylophilus]CAG9096607.1 unnamed protein product [Bursaphelenchus xylophilus]